MISLLELDVDESKCVLRALAIGCLVAYRGAEDDTKLKADVLENAVTMGPRSITARTEMADNSTNSFEWSILGIMAGIRVRIDTRQGCAVGAFASPQKWMIDNKKQVVGLFVVSLPLSLATARRLLFHFQW